MKNDKPLLLVVDDEPDMLSSLIALLRREFELLTAESGEEALEILATHTVHVLMTDQRMPGMTGSELLKRVCQQSHLPVLVLFTGYADIKSVIDAVNTGKLFRYVTKPWEPDQLAELLHEAASEYAQRCKERQLREELGQYLTLSRQMTEKLRVNSSGSGIDHKTLDVFTQECERLETLTSPPSVLESER